MSEYEEDFNKIYFFKTQNECFLPKKVFESQKWSIPELQAMKKELNEIKNLLGKYHLKLWSKHTAFRNRSGLVMKTLTETVKPELLTQAWCKFYEILSHFPVIPLCAVINKKLESLHLCEAPGAFVCALNHYLVLNYPGLEWSWKASTLNPNYEGNQLNEMITDDRFIQHTLSNWIFGDDFSGDITKSYNHKYIINYESNSKISLITADGSMNCMNDPGEQERLVERLHFCETLTALRILQPGGTFVLKIFTIFEESTVNLLFLLNCLFEKVAVFKPCTSKGGNSEVYVINLKFKGFNALNSLWEILWTAYENIDIFKTKSMFFLHDLPEIFLREVQKCSDYFMHKQASTIVDNINKYEYKRHDNILITKTFIAKLYLDKYKVKAIPEESKIVPNKCLTESWTVHSFRKCKNIQSLNVLNYIHDQTLTSILNIVVGKEIVTVHNSKFTYSDNLAKIQNIFINTNTVSDLYKNILTVLKNKNAVINIKEFNVVPFSNFQKQFFTKVSSIINENKNLIFINIPFITHFLVGLLYVLFFLFDKVYMGNGIVFLFQPKLCNLESVQSVFSSIKAKYIIAVESNDQFVQDVVQIVSPDAFNIGTLIEKIWNYNNNIFSENKCFVRSFSITN